jgi:hypothetical protein
MPALDRITAYPPLSMLRPEALPVSIAAVDYF